MLNEKKISKTGSITIPANVRRDIGLMEGEKVKIDIGESDGVITLTRIVGSCAICANNEKLVKIDGKFVCSGCITRLIDLENAKNGSM